MLEDKLIQSSTSFSAIFKATRISSPSKQQGFTWTSFTQLQHVPYVIIGRFKLVQKSSTTCAWCRLMCNIYPLSDTSRHRVLTQFSSFQEVSVFTWVKMCHSPQNGHGHEKQISCENSSTARLNGLPASKTTAATLSYILPLAPSVPTLFPLGAETQWFFFTRLYNFENKTDSTASHSLKASSKSFLFLFFLCCASAISPLCTRIAPCNFL